MNMELTKEEMRLLIEAGGMAPSGGNMQPWKVVARKNEIELCLGSPQAIVMLDVGQLGSYFALGSFFENISIAANVLGLIYETKFFINEYTTQLAVKLLFTGRKVKSKDTYYNFISQRATNRKISDGTIIEKSYIENLLNETKIFDPQYKLTCVSHFDQKQKIVNILSKADGIRMLNNTLYGEMFHEIRWDKTSAEQSKNGIDIASMELPGNADKLFRLLQKYAFIRDILPRTVFENMAKPLLMHSSHIACLSMKRKPTPENMFVAGKIMQRLWLLSTKLDLAIHPWTVFSFFLMRVEYFGGEGFSQEEQIEIKLLGQAFRRILGLKDDEVPVFIFRLSKAKIPSAKALRYSWEEYTTLNK